MNQYELKSPYCPKCDKNITNIHVIPHGVRTYDDENHKKGELLMPQIMFIQCYDCGHVFGILDSSIHKSLKIDSFKERN
jgi:hypothetical protein